MQNTETNGAAIWQGFAGAPCSQLGWWRQFTTYIAARWFDSKHPFAAQNEQWRGAAAFAPELVPLVAICEIGGDFDLSEPVTFSYWCEFLNEYSERAARWREFEQVNGAVDVLG
jgi:hypothetical protein